MEYTEILMILSSALDALSILEQSKVIHTRKSVYGISYDFLGFQALDFYSGFLGSSLYLTKRVPVLYSKRNPVHPTIPISYCLYLLDIFKTIISSVLLYQTYKFRKTKRQEQSFSLYLIGVIAINFIILIFISTCIRNHKYTLNLLDVVGYLWFIQQQATLFKFWPQVTMNWVILNNYQSVKFIKYQVYSLSAAVLAVSLTYYQDWHRIPLNYYNVMYLMNLPLVVIMKYQKDYSKKGKILAI